MSDWTVIYYKRRAQSETNRSVTVKNESEVVWEDNLHVSRTCKNRIIESMYYTHWPSDLSADRRVTVIGNHMLHAI